MRSPVFDACNFKFEFAEMAETATTFVQISIELSETSKVFGFSVRVFQSDDLGLIWATGSLGYAGKD